MALLNKDNNYIKIERDGTVQIYNSKLERDTCKNASFSFEEVLNRYKYLLKETYETMFNLFKEKGITEEDYSEKNKDLFFEKLNSNKDCLEIFNKYNSIYEEFNNYESDCNNQKGPTHDYPIMKETVKDIENTVPVIQLNMGCSSLQKETVKASYEEAKRSGIFGETTDC